MTERTKISLEDGMRRGFHAGHDVLAPEGLYPWTGDGWLEPYRDSSAGKNQHPPITGTFDIKLPPDSFSDKTEKGT